MANESAMQKKYAINQPLQQGLVWGGLGMGTVGLVAHNLRNNVPNNLSNSLKGTADPRFNSSRSARMLGLGS